MCSNFQAITRKHAEWVKQNFQLELPFEEWREEIYPRYNAPFVWLENGKARCDLAEFGLVPAWAADKPKFGLALMQGFYEPNYETGKALRWRIKRSDGNPLAVASIWERFIDHSTGEIRFSFSMLTINATNHPLMNHFHAPEDEKRSIVVLQDDDYQPWLQADTKQAAGMMSLVPGHFLVSEAAPRK